MSSDKKIYCRECGESMDRDNSFCPNCGEPNQDNNPQTHSEPESVPQGSQQSQSGLNSQYRQQNPPQSAREGTGSPLSQNEPVGKGTWWYGIALGTIGWIVIFATVSAVDGSGTTIEGLFGLISLVVWILMPVSAYYDIQFIKATSEWNPNSPLWVIGFIIPVINILLGIVYLYRRYDLLGL